VPELTGDIRAGGPLPRGDDLVQPFQLDGLALRGRLIRMGRVADRILTRHDYPEPVAALLGETLALAATLAGGLKYDGVFTLQTRSDGPIGMMVADVTSEGNMRGYAQLDQARLDAALDSATESPVPRLLGNGHLAFTVDQGPQTERYQGIVDIAGATMAECANHYFRQSEQLDAAIVLAAGQVPDAAGGRARWRAAGITLQRIPGAAGVDDLDEEAREDGWRRALMLMSTVSQDELLGPRPAPNDLLYHLFHEEAVRVYRPRPLRAKCRCARRRVAATLRALPRSGLDDLKIDGKVVVTCQFCNADYVFDDEALDALFAA